MKQSQQSRTKCHSRPQRITAGSHLYLFLLGFFLINNTKIEKGAEHKGKGGGDTYIVKEEEKKIPKKCCNKKLQKNEKKEMIGEL